MLGGLLVDKAGGMTSHDVVARVRRLTATRRVGHAGTLDPFATGVLLVCIGRATRLAQFLSGLDKTYVARVRLGFATDTQDVTGKQITPLQSSKELNEEDVRRVLKTFEGAQLQTPPMYSAKKVGGVRLYRAARQGLEVERSAARITIHAIELLQSGSSTIEHNSDGTADLRVSVRCSSGTYVRTIANDLGAKLGLGAHLVELRRTAVGEFRVEDARTLEQLERLKVEDDIEAALLSPADLVRHLPMLRLDDNLAAGVLNGRAAPLRTNLTGHVRLCDKEGKLLCVGLVDAASELIKPRVVLGEDDEGRG